MGMVRTILHEYKIHNAEVLFREDSTPDDFIDVINGKSIYMPCLYVYNKIDQLNLDYLLDVLWEHLDLLRVYTKKPGQPPDFEDGIILRSGATVSHVCHAIHRTLAENCKYALVWGKSTKFSPQRAGVGHSMADEDVIQIVKK